MSITDLLKPTRVVANLNATSKKQLLQELSKRLASQLELDERSLLDVLLEREKLGSTGVGSGIAIPHGRLDNIDKPIGFFVKLNQPIDFDALDEKPVDLVFLLLAPQGSGADHLKALASVTRLFRDKENCQKLRGTDNSEALYALLIEKSLNNDAA